MSSTTTAPAVQVFLPIPPSVNNLFHNVPGKGRMKSRAYLAWECEARYLVQWPRLTEDRTNRIRWECAIVAHQLARNRDIDNLSKATLDFCCTMTGLRDCYLERLTIAREDGGVPGLALTVWLQEEG